MENKHQNGKGSKPRSGYNQTYRDNWDDIFNKNYDYPEETEGTRIAAEGRARCNKLTREERDKLLEEGLKRIYGTKENK